MAYAVKEIYFTIQGEGFHTGRPAVFLRFAGCNLWSGREEDRDTAICNFCDTDFFGTDGPSGGKYETADELVKKAVSLWPGGNPPFIVCTGGEPLLQLDGALVGALHDSGFEIAIETNGTLPAPEGIDWICVSPKADAELVIRSGDELKLVYPQVEAVPESYVDLSFKYFYLQPMDGPEIELNTRKTIAYCRANPTWRLSLQTHKILGIP